MDYKISWEFLTLVILKLLCLWPLLVDTQEDNSKIVAKEKSMKGKP